MLLVSWYDTPFCNLGQLSVVGPPPLLHFAIDCTHFKREYYNYSFKFQVHSTGGEWCYVEDRHANKGYVPVSYLKAYQQPQQSTAESNNTNTITTTAQLEKVNEEES